MPMANVWDEETMGRLTRMVDFARKGEPDIEDEARAALVAATTFLDALDPQGEQPVFGGSRVALAKNEAAVSLEEVVLAELTTPTRSVPRRLLSTEIIRSALWVKSNGGGTTGWEAFKTMNDGLRTQHLAQRRRLPPAPQT
jgi:hypothetical protein